MIKYHAHTISDGALICMCKMHVLCYWIGPLNYHVAIYDLNRAIAEAFLLKLCILWNLADSDNDNEIDLQ